MQNSRTEEDDDTNHECQRQRKCVLRGRQPKYLVIDGVRRIFQ